MFFAKVGSFSGKQRQLQRRIGVRKPCGFVTCDKFGNLCGLSSRNSTEIGSLLPASCQVICALHICCPSYAFLTFSQMFFFCFLVAVCTNSIKTLWAEINTLKVDYIIQTYPRRQEYLSITGKGNKERRMRGEKKQKLVIPLMGQNHLKNQHECRFRMRKHKACG